MNNDQNGAPVVLITGASSGIGAATAAALAAEGMVVHGTARREDRLAELASATGCSTHVLDVRDADGVADLIKAIGRIDILINNAGTGRGWGSLAKAAPLDIQRAVDTNVTAAIQVVQAVLPGMIKRGEGHIVNIGSMAGLYPVSAALYGATKAAVHALSTNLRLELRGTGIRVTEICPGRVQTEFYDVAIADPGLREATKNSGVEEVTAAECADTIVYALNVARHVNINRIEIQPTEQTYGGSQFVLRRAQS